ncbi:MAG: type IV toxin-antitoxin system AbiEi family antitoxin domain-containing protein [Marmoricola sp.]
MEPLFSLHPNGLFLRREALDFGVDDRELRAARRGGVITRIRHGAYVDSSAWNHLDAVDQYRVRGQAVLLSHHGNVALSHSSGAAEHGLRLWDVDTSLVHVTRLDGGPGGRQGDIVYHVDTCSPADVMSKNELPVLGPQRCALGAAALGSVESGLVLLDSVLDLGLGSEASLWATYAEMARWPGARRLQVIVRLAQPGAQSVGESRSRYLCWVQHLPRPELQFEVYDDNGDLVGITDFAWPEHELLGEFDGKVKYGRLLRPGEEPSDVVFREKVREDRLREVLGWTMVRLVWSDLHHPQETATRIRRQMMRSRAA